MEAGAEVKILQEEVYYPESDGRPMAETDVHRDLMVNLIEGLKDFYRNEPDVYVSGNLFIYFREGDPSACVAPDCFVVKGIKKGKRRTYMLWEEKKTPDVVIEVTSKKTTFEDMNTKKMIYQNELKVEEYFIYDPLGDYLKPNLQGYRLEGNVYKSISRRGMRLKSEVLGLELGVEEGLLRLYDPISGEKILTPLEALEAQRKAEERAMKAEEKAVKEKEIRKSAEDELKKLRGELEVLKKKM